MATQKILISLPEPLAKELAEFADAVKEGNKSGFTADALRAYINYWRRANHTRKLRDAYAASAEESLAISKEWEHVDNEMWERLDELDEKE